MTAPEDLREVLPLLDRERFHLQQLREPEDGVERRAQFMAESRDEFALGRVGLDGLSQTRLQLGDRSPRHRRSLTRPGKDRSGPPYQLES